MTSQVRHGVHCRRSGIEEAKILAQISFKNGTMNLTHSTANSIFSAGPSRTEMLSLISTSVERLSFGIGHSMDVWLIVAFNKGNVLEA